MKTLGRKRCCNTARAIAPFGAKRRSRLTNDRPNDLRGEIVNRTAPQGKTHRVATAPMVSRETMPRRATLGMDVSRETFVLTFAHGAQLAQRRLLTTRGHEIELTKQGHALNELK
ncbi:MAG: hypothetical protein R3C10_02665 [Pirellulales bacterium]